MRIVRNWWRILYVLRKEKFTLGGKTSSGFGNLRAQNIKVMEYDFIDKKCAAAYLLKKELKNLISEYTEEKVYPTWRFFYQCLFSNRWFFYYPFLFQNSLWLRITLNWNVEINFDASELLLRGALKNFRAQRC